MKLVHPEDVPTRLKKDNTKDLKEDKEALKPAKKKSAAKKSKKGKGAK